MHSGRRAPAGENPRQLNEFSCRADPSSPGTAFVGCEGDRTMNHDWLPASRQLPEVDALVAERRYAHAAAVLQATLAGRTPTTAERLRLADLLVLADRGAQALPVLLEVADDLARQGALERALVALRRADAVEPGHPKVKERFVALSSALRVLRARDAAARRAAGIDRDKTDPYWIPEPRASPPAQDAGGALPVDPGLFAFVRALGDQEGGPGRHALAGAVVLGPAALPLPPRGGGPAPAGRSPPGDIVVSEGDAGDSIFLVASGSVRILVLGGHGRPLEIRRIESGDFFGEVAALSGRPRSATVIAAENSELLEVSRCGPRSGWWRPGPRRRSASWRPTRRGRTVRKRRPCAPSPRARAPSGRRSSSRPSSATCEWSPRVRLHLARLMLDAGQEDDALAVLASVAEELADSGHADQGIEILKKVEQLRHSGRRRAAARPRAARRTPRPARRPPAPTRTRRFANGS